MKIGRLLLRLTVGGFFIGHGTQKLFGWFGGHGLEATGGFFEQLGPRPGKRHSTAAGLAEAGGGALLVVGLATPVAASLITATMLTAIKRVHLSKGPWISDGSGTRAALRARTAQRRAGRSGRSGRWPQRLRVLTVIIDGSDGVWTRLTP